MPSPRLRSRRSTAWCHAAATLLLLACTADADDPADAAPPDAAPAPDAHEADAGQTDASATDAALPDAAPAPVCAPLGHDVDASLNVDMAPIGEVPANPGLCMDGALHRLDGRARVVSVSPRAIALQFPDTDPPMDAFLQGSFEGLALQAGGEVDAHVACYGASEIGGHAAVVLTDPAGVLLSAGAGGWSFFAGGPAWGVDAAMFFTATPFTRAPRCTAQSTVDCDHTEETLTFDLPGGPVALSAGQEATVPGTAGDLRVRVAEAFEHFGPQPRCPFTVDGLAFQVARVRPFDGPPGP